MSQRRTGMSEISETRPGRAASQDLQLPFAERPIFIIVGMHRSGASILAKMLQILGVDMAETGADGEGPGWERPEIVAFNDRLLEIIGRPLASPVHSLPFPAGWWGNPRVLALKRDVQAYLREALDGRYGMWGFKDLRVTRLLPFWQQIFDEMGLRPNYLWAVRDPADCAGSAVASGLAVNPEIAEAMWFIYNADIHKFVGEDAVAVVDYADWSDEPTEVVEMLLDRLPLTWRGSHGELLECVREMTARRRGSPASSIQSPLVRTFYDAIRDPDRSDKSLRYRSSVAQAVDILRQLVAPYAALVNGHAASLPAPPPRPALPAANGALGDALARAEQAEAEARETEAVLTRELEARVSENSWLQQQFLDGKRALTEREEEHRRAQSQAEAESQRIRLELEASAVEARATQRKMDDLHAAAERQRRQAKEELEQLRKELALQKTANEKYLSRIYELKAMRRTDGAGDAAPSA